MQFNATVCKEAPHSVCLFVLRFFVSFVFVLSSCHLPLAGTQGVVKFPIIVMTIRLMDVCRAGLSRSVPERTQLAKTSYSIHLYFCYDFCLPFFLSVVLFACFYFIKYFFGLLFAIVLVSQQHKKMDTKMTVLRSFC